MKAKFLIGLLIIVVVVIGGIIVLTSKETKEISSPVAKKQTVTTSSPTVAFAKLEIYKDPSGFEFEYPDSVEIKKDANSDQFVYSSVKVISPKKLGGIQITVTSTTLKNKDEWLKSEKLSIPAVKIENVKLADLDAYRFEKQKKIITATVDTETLFLFTVDPREDKDFWSAVNNKITSSFSFQAPEAPADNSSGTSSSDEVILEGEEVIE